MSIFWKVKSNTEYLYQSTEIQTYAKKIKRYRITDLVGEEETTIGQTAQTLSTRPRVQNTDIRLAQLAGLPRNLI